MEAYRIFISSIMNPANEDLTAEREAARDALDRFAPLAVAWAFEAEPASPKPLLDFYLDAVRSCDAFMLILGQHVTQPVADEVRIALDYCKPILVFCKEVPSRDAETQEMLRTLNVKYDPFSSADELREKAAISLGYHLLALIRGEPRAAQQIGDHLARLRAFARQRRAVTILPTIPTCKYNSFTVEDVNATYVRFQKSGLANVDVPVGRIEDVLETARHEQPVVQLGGRLQWITARQNWFFRPEKPPSPDPLNIGLGRQVPREPDFSEPTRSLLQSNRWEFAWSNPERLAGREVFFDEDGKHLFNGRQILTCKGPQQ